MREKKVLICPKVSKYEWDLHKYRLSHLELIEKYKRERVDYNNILLSHERQVKSRKLVKHIFKNAKIVNRENLTREEIKNVDITISLGGDNHFQYVSHFIDNEYIFGINSDPLVSEGVLLSCNTDTLNVIKKQCDKGNYEIEKWTRLDVYINNEFVSRATCDVFIGEKERRFTSRQILFFNNFEKQQKSSGILVSTGSGSTGWFSSASRFITTNPVFGSTEPFAKFIVTEPYKGTLTDSSLIEGLIKENCSFKVCSLNNNEGIVVLDSLDEFPFPRSTTVSIKISKVPLNVIRFVEKV